MKLIEVGDNQMPIPSAEVRVIRPFSIIFKNSKNRAKLYGIPDEKEGKGIPFCVMEFSFVHFVTVYDSRFRMYDTQEEMVDAIKRAVDLPDEWEPDNIIAECVRVYRDLQVTPSLKLYEAAVAGIEKLKTQLETFDLNERMKSGAFVLKPTEYQAALNGIAKNMEEVKRAEDMVRKEQDLKKRGKGGKEIHLFEVNTPDFMKASR